MIAMIQRNLRLYFRDRSGIFFSLLGALISFILYLVFLKQNMLVSWQRVPNAKVLLDAWLIGGTLVIVGITTTLTGLTLLVADKEKQIALDLKLTDTGALRLFSSYLCSAAIIGILMQIVMLSIMWISFYLTDGLTISTTTFLNLVGLMVLNSVLATMINAVIVRSIHSTGNLNKLSTIVGTAAGFLVGTYTPIGTLPNFAQSLVKLIPGSYIATLYRQFLMDDKLKTAFSSNLMAKNNFEKLMGVRLEWSTFLTQQKTYQIIGLIIIGAAILTVIPEWLQARHKSIDS